MKRKPPEPSNTISPEIADEDIFAAMQEISGYLDITPGDFREVYQLAWRHARERLLRTAKAREIMTRDVAQVKVDTPLKEVAALMARQGVSGVPVVDAAGRAVGVISEKDFLKAMSSGGITSFMGVVAQCLQEKGCKALGIRQGQAADLSELFDHGRIEQRVDNLCGTLDVSGGGLGVAGRVLRVVRAGLPGVFLPGDDAERIPSRHAEPCHCAARTDPAPRETGPAPGNDTGGCEARPPNYSSLAGPLS